MSSVLTMLRYCTDHFSPRRARFCFLRPVSESALLHLTIHCNIGVSSDDYILTALLDLATAMQVHLSSAALSNLSQTVYSATGGKD